MTTYKRSKAANVVKFGKYKGTSVGNVPKDYMIWFLEHTQDSDNAIEWSYARAMFVRQLEAWKVKKYEI